MTARRTPPSLASLLCVVALALGGCTAGQTAPDAAPPGSPSPVPTSTDDVRDEVIYGAVPGLWRRGDESASDAVRRELPRIAELGATVLWLWPPVAAREEGEEYAVVDFAALDESWGSRAEFDALVAAAHAHGLRVIVDVVPNHTSRQHPWFVDATGPESATWEHYERQADGEPEHYFDWEHLPNLDVDRPAVRDAIADSMLELADAGIDGFRLDAAWGPAERSATFWPELTGRLRAAHPDLLLLAEAAAGDDWLSRAGMDLGYDWRGGLGQAAWAEVWGPGAAGALADRIAEPGAVPALRFLDNNDTGDRLASVHPEWARVAALLELTVPGVPLVFAGQEDGAVFEPYELSDAVDADPARMPGGAELTELYQQLIALRRATPALTAAGIEHVVVRGEVLAFDRISGEDRCRVTLNLGADPTTVDGGGLALVLATDPAVAGAGDDRDRLRLPARSGAVHCTADATEAPGPEAIDP